MVRTRMLLVCGGTVKIRSTMAATGIHYVDVVGVIIGEVLGAWLSTPAHLPP